MSDVEDTTSSGDAPAPVDLLGDPIAPASRPDSEQSRLADSIMHNLTVIMARPIDDESLKRLRSVEQNLREVAQQPA